MNIIIHKKSGKTIEFLLQRSWMTLGNLSVSAAVDRLPGWVSN